MSTVGVTPSAGSAGREQPRFPAAAGLGPASALYLVAVVGAAALLVTRFDFQGSSRSDWLLFGVLTAFAAAVQLFTVDPATHQSYSTTLIFFVAGSLLLPAPLVALMIVLVHLPEWARGRFPWHAQVFDVARWTCAALAVSAISAGLVDAADPAGDMTRLALAGAAGAAAYVLVNDALLAPMLVLRRGAQDRKGPLFGFADVSTEVVLASLGVALAAVWLLAPVLIPFLLAPLVVVYRALRLPSLELAARLDPKTDLFNARYLATALEAELQRSKRFDRPLSILLADLDLLRRVNNAHGHLAGDEVLKGVADVLRRELRPFDIPCRFGGEEFAVILPETGHEDAIAIAERIRRVVAGTRFAVPGGDAEIRATVSLGVATHPENGSADELLQQADLALYRSKALGRNRVSGQAAVAGVRPAPVQARTPSVEPARERSSMQREVRLVEAVALLAAVGGVLLGLLAYERLGVLGPAIVAVSALLLAPLGARLVRLRSAVDEVQRRNQELEHRKQRVHRAYLTTVAALSRTADERGGQDWVRRVAVALGRSLGYRQEELEAIEVGAMLHDIGKLRVPDRILTKPGPLTESEWAEVKRHPVEADRLLAEAELHPFVRQIVRSSHERIDGTGYPDGLSGEQIPLPARIVLVADAFDALASDRPYRPARRLPEAIAELRANAGTQFCPTVLAALDRLWVDAPDSLRQTADGRRHTAARH